jgi:immune inhibitor A
VAIRNPQPRATSPAELPDALEQRCVVPPHPDLEAKIRESVRKASGRLADLVPAEALQLPPASRPGLNDGLIIPGSYFPMGTPVGLVRSAAADRAPLRGIVRVVVVLVDFSDKVMTQTAAHFNDLFFSTGVIPTGSVREYYQEVTNGLVQLQGQVVGPYRMPNTLAHYANNSSGLGAAPNARDMARDAVVAADAAVNFGPFDNDSNGFVDAFIVIHAGPGGEVTGSKGDIWSHKWVLSGSAYATDGVQVYGYLTVPEDSKIGVCAHELGHLLFGFPDLYDTDYSSAGLGNWCLMAGGSWNGGGDTPAHPSAWCKANQGWVNVATVTTNSNVTIQQVETSHSLYRLWKDGTGGSEYFLVENRQKVGFDLGLPGDGLCIYHIDESIAGNSDESHYKVGILQADGLRQLEQGIGRGDTGDTFPGSANNTSFTSTSTPNSKSFAGTDTCVSVTSISASGASMTARFTVTCGKSMHKEIIKEKDISKEIRKEVKEKEVRWEKAAIREKPFVDKIDKRIDEKIDKPITDKTAALDKNPISEKAIDKLREKLTDKVADKLVDGPGGGGFGRRGFGGGGFGGGARTGGMRPRIDVDALEQRLQALESAVWGDDGGQGDPGGASAEAFIGSDLRPDLSSGSLMAEDDMDDIRKGMAEGAAGAKRLYDTKPADR